MQDQDWTEEEYLETLHHERRMYAWTLRHHGSFSAAEADAAALAFYRHEGPEQPRRGLVFHDEAWHWAMLRIHGEGYWRAQPQLATPPRAYRDAAWAHELTAIEKALGFIWPRSFRARVVDLVQLCQTPAFRRRWPDMRLLLSTADIAAERQRMDHRDSLGVAGVPLPAEIVAQADPPSQTLIPFLCDDGELPNTYAFDLQSQGAEHAVVVWSYRDPMIVHDYQDFDAFFQWLRDDAAADEKANPCAPSTN